MRQPLAGAINRAVIHQDDFEGGIVNFPERKQTVARDLITIPCEDNDADFRLATWRFFHVCVEFYRQRQALPIVKSMIVGSPKPIYLCHFAECEFRSRSALYKSC